MADSAAAEPSRTAAAAGGLWTALLFLAAALVITGLVWPSGSQAVSLPPGAPIRLKLAGLQTNARVVPIHVEGQILDPPHNPKDVGWWVGSAKPGTDKGQTVITGHTVHTGGGSLNRLDKIQVGHEVDLETKAGTFQYQVDDVDVLSKAEVTKQAERIFGQKRDDGRLVVVTCTDWNGSYYESNIVMYAHPFGELPKAKPTPAKKS